MNKSSQHTIDFLFPIALFFVFTSTALLLLLLAANVYQKVVTESEVQFEQSTALSYISGKIRHNDQDGIDNIEISSFDGCEALAIKQLHNDVTYTTYIYEFDGKLKEIFLQDGVKGSAESGTTILDVKDLKIEKVSDNLFCFSCTSDDGSSNSVIIGVHSNKIPDN